MNKMTLAIVGIVILMTTLVQTSLAADKFRIEIIDFDRGGNDKGTEISIQVGMTEYISNAKAPEILTCVRVWKGCDSLLFDLSPTGANYSMSYDNEPANERKMNQAEAAKRWAAYVKKFAAIRKNLDISIRR